MQHGSPCKILSRMGIRGNRFDEALVGVDIIAIGVTVDARMAGGITVMFGLHPTSGVRFNIVWSNVGNSNHGPIDSPHRHCWT